jgi:hypothetical protein
MWLLRKSPTKDVAEKLRGDKGTKVAVLIFRRSYSEKLLDYVITRDHDSFIQRGRIL